MRDTWPDEVLDEPAILTPRHMLERLSWRIRRFEAYLELPDLDGRSALVAGEKLDRLYQEYGYWFEQHESERRIIRLESFALTLADRLEVLDRRLTTLQRAMMAMMDRMDDTEDDAR
jgi:hypothetical protein